MQSEFDKIVAETERLFFSPNSVILMDMARKNINLEDIPLTKKEQLFVDYLFILDLNGYQAAKKAGYSEKSAYTIASNLLRKVNINKAVQARLAEVHLSADEALAILAKHARGDIGDFMNDFGGVDITEARKQGKTGLIKKLEIKTITINGKQEDQEIHTEKIELHDPQTAIDKILRVTGKYKDAGITLPENSTINIQIVRASDATGNK